MPTAPSTVTVEDVETRTQLRRFLDMPYVVLGADRRWAPEVRAFEQWRFDRRRHPYLAERDHVFLLARRLGTPVGRLAVHVDEGGHGWFGALTVPDDDEVVDALLDRARVWLAERGIGAMTGPRTWTEDEECGVLVHGHEHPARTGAPWQPEWYPAQLHRAGAAPIATARELHRLDGDELHRLAERGCPDRDPDRPRPAVAGGYVDPALVLRDAVAVPDIAALLGGARLRDAWRMSRRVRRGDHRVAVAIEIGPEPDLALANLAAAAVERGIDTLYVSHAPDRREPVQVRQLFAMAW